MEQELRFGLDLGRRDNFPAFIASTSFDLRYTSNEMIQFVAHSDVSKFYEILKNHFQFFIGWKHFQLCLVPLETPLCGTSL
jgi:hypothetical protein